MNQPDNNPNEKWEQDRRNKEMRLWELGAKGDIIAGWWRIIRTCLGFLLAIGLFMYLWFSGEIEKSSQTITLGRFILILALLFAAMIYRVGLGIWEIFLGKSKLLRQKWTWWYTVITMPLAYIYFIFYLFKDPAFQVSQIAQILILLAVTLGFGALYYYTWSIKRKFEPAATEPIKEELQELSRWPASKDRPTAFYILSIIVLFLSVPLILVNGAMLIFSFMGSGPTGHDLLNVVIGFLGGLTFLITGIGLMRVKKYCIVGAILATILLGTMALLDNSGGINIYLYVSIGLLLLDIYLAFEIKKLN